MSDEQQSENENRHSEASKNKISLRPRYKDKHPNPHVTRHQNGRNNFFTPSEAASQFWSLIKVESHVGLLFLLLPIFALCVYLAQTNVKNHWIALFVGAVGFSYLTYYTVEPRKSRKVITRLENTYRAEQFAKIATGIAILSSLSTLTLIGMITIEELPSLSVEQTGITIATIGMLIGLASSYVIIRVLISRALPIKSERPLIDRIVQSSSIIEILFVLAAIGAPTFIFIALFFWNGPVILRLDMTLSQQGAAILLTGGQFIYTALVTRL